MSSEADPLGLPPLFEGGGEPWLPLLRPVLEKNLEEAQALLGPGRSSTIVPLRELTFQALKPNPPGRWRVVVFGQNPYPRVESATGIAMFDNTFADWNDSQFGKVVSMRCIIKAACMHEHKMARSTAIGELRALLAREKVVPPPEWFQAMLAQGVLLMNASLTASSDQTIPTARHTAFWKPVVERIVDEILKARRGEGVVFAWWGTHAKALRVMVERLQEQHPDVPVRHLDHCNPAATGEVFCDGDPLGAINGALAALGMDAVRWLPAKGWSARDGHESQEAERLGGFIEKTRELHKLYLERLQGVGDEKLDELAPIPGVLELPPPTLAEAMAPLIALHPSLAAQVRTAREFARRVRTQAPQLSEHEIGALHLYTAESVLYRQLNATLRDPDRSRATPWRGYLRLFLSATARLAAPGAASASLWRGVARDLRREYTKGRSVTWWGVSSCTSNLAVARGFLGGSGRRMLFEVAPISAVSIRAFSAFTGEDEYVLAPGSRLDVVEVKDGADGLCHVRLSERPATVWSAATPAAATAPPSVPPSAVVAEPPNRRRAFVVLGAALLAAVLGTLAWMLAR